MASILNATTTNGLVTSADNSGSLQLQTNNGTAALSISTGQQLQVHTAGTASAPVISKSDDTNTGIFFPAADTIAFTEGGTESMRIDSSGRLLLGTTAVTTSSSQSGEIYSTGAVGFMMTNTTAGNYALSVKNEGTSGTRNLINFYEGSGGGTSRGSITTNGTTVSYNTSSDYRLKENIAPMTGALARVSALKPVTYSWKVDGSAGQGFIAHELQEVVPDAVTGEKDAVNEDGSIKPQGVDTSFLVATLTAAIQELKAELDTVKAELNTLKNPPVEGTE